MIIDTYTDLAIVLTIIGCFGLCGNIINLIVLGNKNMRKMSTFKFLFYLSIIDMLVIIFCASDTILSFGFAIQIREKSKFSCKFHTFLTYFLTHLSNLVLAFVSIERVIVIYSKQSTISKYFKHYRVEKVIFILILGLILIDSIA